MSHKIEIDPPFDIIAIMHAAHLPNTNARKLKEARDAAWNAISSVVKQIPDDTITEAVDFYTDSLAEAKRKRPGADESDASDESEGSGPPRKKNKRSPETFQVFVKGLSGMKRAYNVHAGTTTADLAAKVEARDGIPVDQQRLIYSGKQPEGLEVDDEREVLLSKVSSV